MTRLQALTKIAKKEADNYCENSDKLIRLLMFGNIGLTEKTNKELEELHQELFNKSITIKG